MNREQRHLLVFGAWASLLLIAFPPWCVDDVIWFGQHAQPQTRAVGYAFIACPPTGGRLDVARLLFQLVGLTSLIAAHAWARAPARQLGELQPLPTDGIRLSRARGS